VSSLATAADIRRTADVGWRQPRRLMSATHFIPAIRFAKVSRPRRPVFGKHREFRGPSQPTALAASLPATSRRTAADWCRMNVPRQQRRGNLASDICRASNPGYCPEGMGRRRILAGQTASPRLCRSRWITIQPTAVPTASVICGLLVRDLHIRRAHASGRTGKAPGSAR